MIDDDHSFNLEEDDIFPPEDDAALRGESVAPVPNTSDDVLGDDSPSKYYIDDTEHFDQIQKLSYSERFVTVNPGETHILIWGTTQSGKTTFLATLLRELQEDRFPGINLAPGNKVAQQWEERIFLRVFSEGRFPDATPIRGFSTPVFNLAINGKILKLVFLDGPGDLFRDPEQATQQYNLSFNILSYMRQCHGLIMLVDPTLAVKRDPHDELNALGRNLGNLLLDDQGIGVRVKVDMPVAFCLTKCDEPEHRAALDDIDSFLQQYFGKLIRLFSGRVRRARWFASSALGFEPGQPTNTFIRWDGTLGIRDYERVNPINVPEPLLWVLTELGIYSANLP